MSLGREQTESAARAADQSVDAPTQQISMAAVSDRCVNCGAPLASDQRYCVNCGERRGKPRFTVAVETDGEDAVTTVTTTSGSAPRRTRTSATFNLIAGVATLLLALGVGVLIGHNSTSATSKAPATQVITVGGNNSGASTNAASNAGNTGSSSSGSGKSSKSHKSSGSKSNAAASAKAPPPKVVVQKAAAAANKVTGGSAPTASPTVTAGGQCSDGEAGCQNGKFTGNMFGN
jgi:hypothetical protein